MKSPTWAHGASVLASAALLVLAGLLLYTVGRPLFTDDLWWHLGLGRAYLAEGPRLEADPLLFAAEGPPVPASWLSDSALYALLEVAGFTGLRVFHTLCVIAILALCWRTVRRAGAPPAIAALGTGIFVILAAYRLFQLRPGLASILLTLAIYALVIAPKRAPGYPRIALCAALGGLWANLHAGFLLGPILLGAALLGIATTLPLQAPTRRAAQRERAGQLLLALGLTLLATLCNPVGLDAHLTYFAAGDTTPDLSVISDEWTRFPLFGTPRPNTPPAPLVWGLVWVALLGMAIALPRALRSWRDQDDAHWIDPAQLAVSAAGLAATLLAVRFSWLAFFALLLWVTPSRAWLARPLPSLAATGGALLLVPGFLYLGDWPFLSRGVPRDLPGYAAPYAAHKYYANAAWFLRDTGVEGKVFTNYFHGGFYGLWLAPRLRVFVNGSLNVPQRALDDYVAIQKGKGLQSRSEMLTRLARNDLDFFVGVGLPTVARPNRPWRYTNSHLEGAPDWILVYRNLQASVYLRTGPTGRAQIPRIARYYRAKGVPFDPETGLDLSAALREAPGWAISEGVVPSTFLELENLASQRHPGAQDRLAGVYAALGLHAHAVEIDRRLVQARGPTRQGRQARQADRRLVWCLLHLGRWDEALDATRRLGSDPVSAHLAATARRLAEQEDPGRRAFQLAFLPLFSHAEASRVASGRAPMVARPFTAP